MGPVYDELSDFTKALECYELCLKIIIPTDGANHQNCARCYVKMAGAYAYKDDVVQDDIVKSLEYYEKAVKIFLAT